MICVNLLSEQGFEIDRIHLLNVQLISKGDDVIQEYFCLFLILQILQLNIPERNDLCFAKFSLGMVNHILIKWVEDNLKLRVSLEIIHES